MDPSSSSTSETASATDRLFTLTLGPLLGRQATQSATISGDDLEEVWERAITVARVDLPNRYLCARVGMRGVMFGQKHAHIPTRRLLRTPPPSTVVR